jgi:hypothetical protein
MKLINRGIMLVKPNNYFLDWLNQLPDSVPGESHFTIEDIRKDCTAFLLPDVVSEGSIDFIIEPIKTNLFEMELADWCIDPDLWPADRTSETFDQWFDLEYHSMVWDLLELPIQASDEDETFDPLMDDYPDDEDVTPRSLMQEFEPALAFKRQDSVVVRPGTKEPGRPQNDMSGWQGRVIDFMEGEADQILALIEWDSFTLENMPQSFVEERADHSWDWEAMSLDVTCLELTRPRDNYYRVERAQAKLSARHFWPLIPTSGQRISQFLLKLDLSNDSSIFTTWQDSLEEQLKFPFEACIERNSPGSPAIKGDFVTITKLTPFDSLTGVQGEVHYRNFILHIPLANIIVLNESSSNHQLIDDYKLWFDYTL